MHLENKKSPDVLVAAIIINYLDTGITLRCLQSLLNEAFETVYILDNSGSGKFDPALEQKIDELNRQTLINFSYIKSELNLGFAKGVNFVLSKDLKASGHDYYILINNDVVVEKPLVEKLIMKHEQTYNAGLVMPKICWGGQFVGFNHYQRFTGLLSQHEFLSFPYITGCCVLFNREILTAQGRLFDERFFMYGEDVELSWRLMQQGKELCYAPNTLVTHAGTGSSTKGGLFYEYYVAKSHFLLISMLSKNNFEYLLMYAVKSPVLLVRALIRSVRYKTFIPLRAYWMALFNHADTLVREKSR